MKWILLLICFVTTTAFGQTDDNSVMEKLKKTDKLMGRDNYNNFNPKLGTLTPMLREPIRSNNERAVTSLPLDNMPCIVPYMNLLGAMPNAGSLALLENPIDPGIYVLKQKTHIRKIKPSN